MSYYVRLLTPNDDQVTLTALQSVISSAGHKATLVLDAGSDTDWSELVLAHSDGVEIAVVERNDCDPGELGEEELEELREQIEDAKPETAVRWLCEYFDRVKVIYAFQVLSGTELRDGWAILEALKSALWSKLGGIFQADAEGFSNEDGYHILWQFDHEVTGASAMAVLNSDGTWTTFEMDLGNSAHREAFYSGRVPTD